MPHFGAESRLKNGSFGLGIGHPVSAGNLDELAVAHLVGGSYELCLGLALEGAGHRRTVDLAGVATTRTVEVDPGRGPDALDRAGLIATEVGVSTIGSDHRYTGSLRGIPVEPGSLMGVGGTCLAGLRITTWNPRGHTRGVHDT